MKTTTLILLKPLLKLILSLFLLLFCTSLLYSQTVNIPDPVLKQRLLDYDDPVIDTNGDGEIQVAEAEVITELTLVYNSNNPNPGEEPFDDVTGLEYFVNLTNLNLSGNNITSIDLSSLIDLEELWLNSIPLQQVDLSQNISLKILNIANTSLESLDTSFNSELIALYATHNSMSEIDVSNNPNLENLSFWGNDQLNYVNLKNGNSVNIYITESFLDVPNLQMVCVDDTVEFLNSWYGPYLESLGAIVTTDCDFDPSSVNTITGETKINYGQGCDDPSSFGVSNIIIKSEGDGDEFATITNQDGAYTLYTKTGENNVGAKLLNPPYWNALPDSYNFHFTGFDNFETADFCMEATEYVEDLNVSFYGPCPGFSWGPWGGDVRFLLLTVENMGTEIADGAVKFYHSDDFFHYDPTTQSAIPQPEDGVVQFSFSDLKPFQQQTFTVYLSVIPQPSFEAGDIIEFSAHVTPDENDYTPEDNTFTSEMMVNTTDPNGKPMTNYYANNKRVMDGEEIHIDDADQYLHYLINFQNTGNANADYVKVIDTLSDKLDWTTFRLDYTSHDYRVEIKNDYIFNFIFEDIDLPYEDEDEEASQGYIAYKVKPKSDVEIGDVIGSQAHIFFDDNPAIITNLPTTTIVENLSVDKPVLTAQIKLYPNPTDGWVNLQIPENIEIQKINVFNMNGSLVWSQEPSDKVDLSSLSSGVYFMEFENQKGNKTVKRFIKK